MELELLKVSRYNRNVKALHPYLARHNVHVPTLTSSSTTTKSATKACSKTWSGMVWSCLYIQPQPPFCGGGIANLNDPDSYAGWISYPPGSASQVRQVEG